MNEEQLKQMRIEVTAILKISAEQAKTTLLLLGAVRTLSSQLPRDDFWKKVQMEIQSIPFDIHISKGDQDRMKEKAIELIPVYFP